MVDTRANFVHYYVKQIIWLPLFVNVQFPFKFCHTLSPCRRIRYWWKLEDNQALFVMHLLHVLGLASLADGIGYQCHVIVFTAGVHLLLCLCTCCPAVCTVQSFVWACVWNFFLCMCICVASDIKSISMVILHFSMSISVVCFYVVLFAGVSRISSYKMRPMLYIETVVDG